MFAQSTEQANLARLLLWTNSRTREWGRHGAPLKTDVLDHDVSIQVGDTVYVCSYHAQSGQELSWLQGKDVQVRIKGKVIYVKRPSKKDAQARIVRTTKADQP
jgi:hypothetical protein